MGLNLEKINVSVETVFIIIKTETIVTLVKKIVQIVTKMVAFHAIKIIIWSKMNVNADILKLINETIV